MVLEFVVDLILIPRLYFVHTLKLDDFFIFIILLHVYVCIIYYIKLYTLLANFTTELLHSLLIFLL